MLGIEVHLNVRLYTRFKSSVMSSTNVFFTQFLLLFCVVLFSVTDSEECEGEIGRFECQCARDPEVKNSCLNCVGLIYASAWGCHSK